MDAGSNKNPEYRAFTFFFFNLWGHVTASFGQHSQSDLVSRMPTKCVHQHRFRGECQSVLSHRDRTSSDSTFFITSHSLQIKRNVLGVASHDRTEFLYLGTLSL